MEPVMDGIITLSFGNITGHVNDMMYLNCVQYGGM